jgi:uncharacterized protein
MTITRSLSKLVLALGASLVIANTASGLGLVCWHESQCQPIPDASELQVAPAQVPQARAKKAAMPTGHATKARPTEKVRATSAAKVGPDLPRSPHKVAFQVNERDKQVMDLALNNAKNVADYYKGRGESVIIEIVAYGPGLHMLRADTSPVKDRIAPMALENPSITFIACGNTQANQSKAEGKPVTLLSEAKVTRSGVVHLMELQKQGYAYIRP